MLSCERMTVTQATINHRIHPMDTIDTILEHDRFAEVIGQLVPREVIGDDRVSITTSSNSFNPPPISPYSNDVMAFQVVAAAALQVPPPPSPHSGLEAATRPNQDFF